MKQLSTTTLYILIALADRPRHGYDIMQAVDTQTNGTVTLGPGTLYGAIKRLLEDGLIEPASEITDAVGDGERRHYYRLTKAGRALLAEETEKMEQLVRRAKHALGHSGVVAWTTNA